MLDEMLSAKFFKICYLGVYFWNTIFFPFSIRARGGTNIKIPNFEHLKHLHTELRTL